MTRSRQSVLAAWQVEEQAYQSSHSRDFEGLTSGTRAVHKRIVRTVGEVRQPCVCVCVCARVHVLSQRMPPGCQHIWTVMDYLGLGCYSKRETPATGGGGVHIKCIGYLSILVVCSLSCHCVPTVWHSEDCVACCPPQLR